MHTAARAWFLGRTATWRDWSLPDLIAAKGTTRTSVVLPALDEEETVGAIVAGAVPLRDAGLVDEIVVIDSGSVERSAAEARAAGASRPAP
jgi:glucosyl-3-phosphoglycerate synthase